MGKIKISLLFLIILPLSSLLGPSGLYLISHFMKASSVQEAFKGGLLHSFLVTLQLPKLRLPLPAAFLSVTVKGPTLQFSSRKLVTVQNSESLVFIQTDKPIYKPGQTGTRKGWRFAFETNICAKTVGSCRPDVSCFQWGSELQPHG